MTGAHPVFALAYEGIEDDQLGRARFRIVLSEDRFRTEAYVFDQVEQRAGWLPGEPGRMLYRPRRPIRVSTPSPRGRRASASHGRGGRERRTAT